MDDDSKNESSDYFGNLHKNIKAMLLKEEVYSDEDKESEESF